MDISLTSIKNTILHILHRYHALLFMVITAAGLAFVVLTMNAIVTSSSASTDYKPGGTTTTFDQETIDRVNSLKSRDEATGELNLVTGRSNPFVEN